MNKYCKGCLTVRRLCMEFNTEGGCPCTNCLIKPMCQDACCDFIEFELKAGNQAEEEILIGE